MRPERRPGATGFREEWGHAPAGVRRSGPAPFGLLAGGETATAAKSSAGHGSNGGWIFPTSLRLLERLDTRHSGLTNAKPRSMTFRDALHDIGRIAAELQRRDRADEPPAAPNRRPR
jgi:hypothetical protein